MLMNDRLWMAMLAAATLGLAACGGDANGSDEMSDMADTAEEMVDEAGNMAADAADRAGEAADATDDAAADGMGEMSQELPEGVTSAMVEQGKTVYEGPGICSSCHGPSGEGIPNLGANLTDDEWLHADGSYESIVQTVMSGVTAEESSSGVPMPARAGTNITDEQVRAAAAYVWTLSR